ncbi:hypothetical protein D3C76_212330 [compost metagenome]
MSNVSTVVQAMDIPDVIRSIQESSATTKVYVGADSKRVKGKVVYVTVVVLHFDGNKGGKIFKEITVEPWYGNIKGRLMNEVYNAVGIGYQIVEHLQGRPFEIHLDLNPDDRHKSNIAVKEAVGYVLGTFGFRPKLKPEAWCGSTVADRDTLKARKGVHKRLAQQA